MVKASINSFIRKMDDTWADTIKVDALINSLYDAPRSGRNLLYGEEINCKIMALALRPPKDFDREITHWGFNRANE